MAHVAALQPLELDRGGIEATVRALLAALTPADCNEEEWALANELGALPILAAWAPVLLLPWGVVVHQDIGDPDELEFDGSDAALAFALVLGRRRWPELASFIPARPDSAPDCPTCSGSALWPRAESRSPCPACSGLGWAFDVDPRLAHGRGLMPPQAS